MTQQSNIKLTIALADPDLEEEELEKATRKLVQEMSQLDEVEQASLVKTEQAPEGSKALAGFVLGLLQAEVSVANIQKVLGFLGDRLGGKPIEIEVEAPNGRKLKVKASSREELLLAIQAAEDFITPD
ncbi:MAG TPA: hypothetical protein V6C91_10310 [Coleofasciculaceae cyanobacterium]